MRFPELDRFYGVDFSGAKRAGNSIWVAELAPVRRGFSLRSLRSLAAICGTAERSEALAHLVDLIRMSDRSLWGFDFPFGLPVDLFPAGARWTDQFDFLREWADDAYGCGLECVRRALKQFSRMHIMRATDVEARTPFDSYHYRLIYQTFFGMRDVIDPLRQTSGTAVLPFQYRKLATAKRVLVESCPASTLKRMKVPHQNYKQPGGGPLTRKRRLTRHAIIDWLSRHVRINDRHYRVMMRNPGGDAIDAVISAVGAALVVPVADHRSIARHPRYRHEGRVFV